MKSYAEALKADAHNRLAMTDDPAASGSSETLEMSAFGDYPAKAEWSLIRL